MNVLIVFAHPNPHSFCAALRDTFIEGVRTNEHTVKIIDLYRDEFNPASPGDNQITPIVNRYQKKLKNCDYLVFIYPIWWFRAPAILEGWFDRVFTPGFAFKFKHLVGNYGRPIGLLPCKQALIINTYGSPAIATKYFYMNIPFRRLKRGILKMCGVKKIKRFNCWSVPFVTDEKRKKYLDKVFKLGKKIK
jgi:NAD(P)H dehydrogenase (quinone)